ncbi:MAG: RNA polymerase sigma factor [Chloroflexi bacterium]|nr:RNA polymerase sigma factor [Chloroflexota bacterium]
MTNLNLTQEIPTRSQTANAPLVIRAMTDQTAFVELYQIWVRPVYRFLYSKVSDHEIAEDLTSQTFMTILESIHKLRDANRFAPWLFRIARNKATNYFRKNKRERLVDNDWVWEAASVEMQTHSVSAEELIALRQLLAGLSDLERELLSLRFLANLRYREIGRVLGKPESTIKKTIYRVIAQIQRNMEKENERN